MKIVEYAGDKEDFVLAKIIRTSFDADTACHLGQTNETVHLAIIMENY